MAFFGKASKIFAAEAKTSDRFTFERYVGIDYSGAQTPKSSLKGLHVCEADRLTTPHEVMPPPSPRKYWTRKEVAEWLVEKLSEGPPTLVGIDHGFSFPLRYFEQHGLPLDWPSFLDDFQRHWPTDEDIYVDFVRDGLHGNGAARSGDPRWRRLTELRARTAKSVFHFDVQGSVAKSTHAGIPWLRYIRRHAKGYVHFWPFDGWIPPANCSVVAEVYPALRNRTLANGTDQNNAIEIVGFANNGGGSLTCRTVSGGATTQTNILLTALPNTSLYQYEIIATTSSVQFYVNGTLVATHTTDIPTMPLNAVFLVSTSQASSNGQYPSLYVSATTFRQRPQ